MTAILAVAQELRLNVEEQTRLWGRLLELSNAQLRALQAQDAPTVHAVLQELEVAMLERSRVEVRRSILLEQAGTLLGVPAGEVTRDLIAASCGDEQLAHALARAAEELKSLVVELDAVVARNSAMLEQELAIIEVLVQGATVDTSQRTTYGKHGMQHEAPRLRLLDAQV